MLQIKSLSKDQIARFPEWVEKWVAVGLSTERTDFATCEKAVLSCYAACNLTRPRVLLRVGSPFGATLGGAIGVVLLGNKQVYSQVESQVASQVAHGLNNYRSGQFWASWYAYVSFLRDVCGWTNPALKLFALDEALQGAGRVWWHEQVCAISDRPERLKRDERGRLHAADGMAIQYPDGWGIYAWHGVRVTGQIIERPDTLEAEHILAESNAEVRRVMIERLGLDRFLTRANAQPIHTDDRRALYKIAVKNDEQIVAVKVQCPSTGQTYFLRVPPQIDRCDKAVAWTFGFDKVRDYNPLVET